MNIKSLLVTLGIVLVIGSVSFLLSFKGPDNISIPDPNKCMGIGLNCPCPMVATDRGWKQGSCVKEKT